MQNGFFSILKVWYGKWVLYFRIYLMKNGFQILKHAMFL